MQQASGCMADWEPKWSFSHQAWALSILATHSASSNQWPISFCMPVRANALSALTGLLLGPARSFCSRFKVMKYLKCMLLTLSRVTGVFSLDSNLVWDWFYRCEVEEKNVIGKGRKGRKPIQGLLLSYHLGNYSSVLLKTFGNMVVHLRVLPLQGRDSWGI